MVAEGHTVAFVGFQALSEHDLRWDSLRSGAAGIGPIPTGSANVLSVSDLFWAQAGGIPPMLREFGVHPESASSLASVHMQLDGSNESVALRPWWATDAPIYSDSSALASTALLSEPDSLLEQARALPLLAVFIPSSGNLSAMISLSDSVQSSSINGFNRTFVSLLPNNGTPAWPAGGEWKVDAAAPEGTLLSFQVTLSTQSAIDVAAVMRLPSDVNASNIIAAASMNEAMGIDCSPTMQSPISLRGRPLADVAASGFVLGSFLSGPDGLAASITLAWELPND